MYFVSAFGLISHSFLLSTVRITAIERTTSMEAHFGQNHRHTNRRTCITMGPISDNSTTEMALPMVPKYCTVKLLITNRTDISKFIRRTKYIIFRILISKYRPCRHRCTTKSISSIKLRTTNQRVTNKLVSAVPSI